MGPGPLRDRISDLYHRALACTPEDRNTFLEAACDGDAALRDELESLLRYEADSARFLETPVAVVAHDLEGTPNTSQMIGRQLGPYTITAPLGSGGMGEVYRARDTKLGRDVAIKILPSQFTADPERRVRFAREARLLATLNHPHIGAIYGLEESDGVTALVLELVEGPSLADRLARGPLPVAEALAIARQIAAALDAAHQKGIVHRDLKPANVVLQAESGSASDARAKVLDFGLAKTLMLPGHGQGTVTEDRSSAGTAEGRVLGTPAYMSPEQARGQAVDKRTDIWAFGCVLFEMLSGQRPFEGGTVTDTLARILERDPDWSALATETPAPVRTLLARCLRKDPRKRLHDIADALIEIDDCSTHDRREIGEGMPRAQGRSWLPWLLAAAIATAGWAALRNRPAAPLSTPELVEVAVSAPDNSRFAGHGIAISPDGRHIAFIATSRMGSSLWVRSMDTFEPREIPDTKGARNPFWSPDSKSIGYFQERNLKTVPVNGGSSFTVCATGPPQSSYSNSGGSWSGDGVIVFGPLEDGALYRISAKGGTPTPVTVPKSTGRGDRWPWFLDDGQHFLYLAGDTAFELRVGSLRSAPAEIIGPLESHAAYGAGYLFFVRGGNLMAQRFDSDRRKLLGDPIDLGRRTGIEPHNQHGMFAMSAAGPLVYRAAARTKSQLTWFDRSGSPRGTLGEIGVYFNLDLSPDERRLAVSRMTEKDARSEFDVWTIELATGNATRLTDDYPAWQFDPTWSPDGQRLAFNEKPIPTKGQFGLSILASSGHGEAESLVPSEPSNGSVSGPDWSGSDIIVYQSGADLWTIAMSGDRKPKLFLDTKYREANGTLSPNGRWIAHQSNAPGHDEVYVRPFPASEPTHRISREGGMYPPGGKTARNCSSWRQTAR
jgi:serine/threonine protein kinase